MITLRCGPASKHVPQEDLSFSCDSRSQGAMVPDKFNDPIVWDFVYNIRVCIL